MLDSEKEARDVLDEKMKKEILSVEKNSKTLLNSFSKERLETEKRVF